jgi:PAS domain S-box-containing protein
MNLDRYLNPKNSKPLILNSSLATIVAIALLYFALAETGFLFVAPPNNIAPIFLATGLGLAGTLILGYNALIGLWIGAFFANLIHLLALPSEHSYITPLIISALIATGAMLGAGISSSIIQHFCKGESILHNGKNVLILILLGCTIYPIIAASIGVISLIIGDFATWRNFAYSWATWCLSDAVGALVLAPFILSWYYKDSYKINFQNSLELALLGVMTILLCCIVFFQREDLKYLIILLMLIVAYRFGMRITTTVILIITLFSTIITSLGIGPFAKSNIIDSILSMDLFSSAISICGLVFSGVLSERQRAEDLIKISESNLRKNKIILESTIESPKDVSIYSLGLNYEYLSFNSLHRHNMKLMNNIEIASGMTLHDCLIDKEELNEAIEVLSRVFLGENITTVRHFDVNNSYWELRSSPIINQNKEIIGATVISTNITDQINAKEALKKSEEKYRNIFENIHDVIFQTDPSGIFLDLSPSVKEITGYTPEELIGKPTNVLQTDEEEKDAVINLINKQLILINFEKLIKTKSGSLKYISLSAKMIFDKKGIPHHIDAVAQDITQRKENEKEIAIQNNKLQIQNKELEQFAYITSHDLQEPLLTLNCFTELVKAEFPHDANENIKQYLDFILESSIRMQTLVKGLLDYSRIGRQIELTKVDCNEIVKDTISSLSDIIQKANCQITTENLPLVKGYSVELIQLFQHLITNAIKFRRRDVPLKININAKLIENNWTFTVEDNGIGIEENDKEKIFIIFKRLNNRDEYPGIGIGLAICKKIVSLHGGTIWAETTFGKGTTINFTIPNSKIQ